MLGCRFPSDPLALPRARQADFTIKSDRCKEKETRDKKQEISELSRLRRALYLL
jgi:hypothetical protein